ncbi:ABC transporter permease [Dactylosporangium sp. CA-092794]|uniref:ABC transporter permease n=1 Tax=Dactylosporangium sp. CA-092794 TaxID=3239929 RepID=UPI003D8ABEEC
MRRALHAEWTKLRTARGLLWLLPAIAAATAGLSAAAAAAVSCGTPCAADLTKLSLTGVQLGQAVVAVLAVLAIGDEYATGTIRVSLAAVPRRTALLAAKALVTTAAVGAAATAGVAGSLLAGGLLLPGHGGLWRPAIGSVLYLILIGLLSLGVATAVRSSAAAAGIVLALLYAWPVAARAVTDPAWTRRLDRIGPMTAGTAIQATRDLAALPIGPWPGLGVLALWALAALLAGWLLLLRRDA